MKHSYLLLVLFILCSPTLLSQTPNKNHKPISIQKAASFTKVPPIASKGRLLKSAGREGIVKDGRSVQQKIIIGKGNNTPDFFAKNPHKMKGAIAAMAPSLVFETVQENGQPTDPSGALGPNHYFAVFNTGFRIFDKQGVALTEKLDPLNIFPDNNHCCDLTVSYDNLADRWVVTILSSTNGVQVALSDGPDPLNDGWNVYLFEEIDDYNKLSVWRDGYYITQNGSPNQVWVLEREAALAGDENANMIGFELPGLVVGGFNSAQAFNITNDVHPETGAAAIVYLQDDAWQGVDNDHIKLWEVNLDLDNFQNSTISDPQEIVVTDFVSVFDGGSFSNLEQPNGGQKIDALQATIMNQAQFRKFDNYNAAVFNFVVDVDATAQNRAGIRWIEFRQPSDGAPWSLYQEGTYTAPDGKHAWCGSLAMDALGNIGMGYTAMAGPNTPTDGSVDLFLSTYYTGRFANDELGVMSIQESLIGAGQGNIPGSNRYGDYGKMEVDPIGGRRFWFLNEYVGPNGRANVLGVFQIAPTLENDAGIVVLNAPSRNFFPNSNTAIDVEIFNYGSTAISNFDISYQIDNGPIITEMFSDVIQPSETASFSFNTLANLDGAVGTTYEFSVCTQLSGDDDSGNDCKIFNVELLEPNDIGVTNIISPSTPTQGSLSSVEDVVVVLENFGAAPQSNFDVNYRLDQQATVTETVENTIEPGEEFTYTFDTTVNLSEIKDYQISSSSFLNGDSNVVNNTFIKDFSNQVCTTVENTTSASIGPAAGTITNSILTFDKNFEIQDVSVTVNLNHSYVSDLDIYLISPQGIEVELSTGNGSDGQDYTNTTFNDAGETDIVDATSPFSGIFKPEGALSDYNGIVKANGDWTLRITDTENQDGGTLLNWSLTLCGPEIALTTEEELLPSTEFLVINQGENLFDIQLQTMETTENLQFQVFNITGQKLLDTRLSHSGSGYQYDLNMSYAATGVYIVRLGNSDKSKVKRIIVK